MKTIFKDAGGTYAVQRDYSLPELHLPQQEQREIGI